MGSGRNSKGKAVSPCLHPTEKKVSMSTYTPSSVSIGKRERALLGYLIEKGDERFNVKKYSRIMGVQRATIYNMLNRLKFKGLVKKPHYGDHAATKMGKAVFSIGNGSVQKLRTGCRDRENLSLHFTRFSSPILGRENFSEGRICELGGNSWKRNDLPNLRQYFVYFDDATLIINPKKLVIRVHDIVAGDTEEALFQSTSKALRYLEKVSACGLMVDSLQLEAAHYARVESLLADTLSKIDGRFFIDMGDGRKFWIDNSGGKAEDETNDADMRERLDGFMQDLFSSDSVLGDVDKLKELQVGFMKMAVGTQKQLGILVNSQISASSQMQNVMGVISAMAVVNKETACGLNSVVSVMKSQLPKQEDIVPPGRPDYFG